jgi:hypothetical protein
MLFSLPFASAPSANSAVNPSSLASMASWRLSLVPYARTGTRASITLAATRSACSTSSSVIW